MSEGLYLKDQGTNFKKKAFKIQLNFKAIDFTSFNKSSVRDNHFNLLEKVVIVDSHNKIIQGKE